MYLCAREDAPLATSFEKHLSALKLEGRIDVWHEGLITPGEDSHLQIQQHIASASIIILLISADFIASSQYQAILEKALSERNRRHFHLLAILVRPIDWQVDAKANIYVLPRNGRAVTVWSNPDAAWQDITFAIRRLMKNEVSKGGCPFPGLEAFDEEQASLFVGRETEIREAIAGLGQTTYGYRRWLQVEGASGSGKSSLVRAGIAPAIRRHQVKGGPKDWLIGVLRPGRDPVTNIAVVLIEIFKPIISLRLKDVVDSLRENPFGLRDLIRQHTPRNNGILLIVDQLEELFTLADLKEKTSIADVLIGHALQDADGPLHLITTIRSDFINHLSGLTELDVNQAFRYLLRPMTGDALREMLAAIAQRAQLEWEDGLLDRLITDTSGLQSNLPLVGHILQILWTERTDGRLTNASYQKAGGVSGALSQSADQVLDSLGQILQPRARVLLLSLVNVNPRMPGTRRVVTRSEALLAAGGGSEAEQVLVRLSGGRDPNAPAAAPAPPRIVMVSSADTPELDRVELVHDSILQQWDRLSKWVEEDRKILQRRDDLESQARAWTSAQRPLEGLPTGALLAYYQALDLTEPQHELFTAQISTQARDFLKNANSLDRSNMRRKSQFRLLTAGIVLAASIIIFFKRFFPNSELALSICSIAIILMLAFGRRAARKREREATDRLHAAVQISSGIISLIRDVTQTSSLPVSAGRDLYALVIKLSDSFQSRVEDDDNPEDFQGDTDTGGLYISDGLITIGNVSMPTDEKEDLYSKYRRTLTESYINIGEFTLLFSEMKKESRQAFEKAESLLTQQLRTHPDSVIYRILKVLININLAKTYKEDDFEKMNAYLESAETSIQQLRQTKNIRDDIAARLSKEVTALRASD